MEKVEVYLHQGQLYRTKEAAEEAEIVAKIIDRLIVNDVITRGHEFSVGRALGYVVRNFSLTPK